MLSWPSWKMISLSFDLQLHWQYEMIIALSKAALGETFLCWFRNLISFYYFSSYFFSSFFVLMEMPRFSWDAEAGTVLPVFVKSGDKTLSWICGLVGFVLCWAVNPLRNYLHSENMSYLWLPLPYLETLNLHKVPKVGLCPDNIKRTAEVRAGGESRSSHTHWKDSCPSMKTIQHCPLQASLAAAATTKTATA